MNYIINEIFFENIYVIAQPSLKNETIEILNALHICDALIKVQYLSSEGLIIAVHSQWWGKEQWHMWHLPQLGKWQRWRSWETWWPSVLVWCPWPFQENSTQSIPWKLNTSHTEEKYKKKINENCTWSPTWSCNNKPLIFESFRSVFYERGSFSLLVFKNVKRSKFKVKLTLTKYYVNWSVSNISYIYNMRIKKKYSGLNNVLTYIVLTQKIPTCMEAYIWKEKFGLSRQIHVYLNCTNKSKFQEIFVKNLP